MTVRRTRGSAWGPGGTLLLAAVLVLLLPCPVRAQPPAVDSSDAGTATLLFQFNRSATPAPIVLTGRCSRSRSRRSRAPTCGWTRGFVPNFGRIDASVDFANGAGSRAPRRGRVALSDVRVGAWTTGIALGDVPFDAYTLDFGVGALYRPFTGLRGGQLSAARGRADVGVFGGRTTTFNGFFGESVLVSDQSVVGARARVRLSPGLQLGAGVLHTTGAEASAVAARSTNSASVSAIYEATPVLRFLGEASVASLSHEEPSATRARWDTSYIIGSRVRSARLTGELSLLRLGPGYLPLAYTSLGDRAGVFGSADYRLHRRVAVSGAVNRWHNNLRSWPARPTLDADNRQLGTRVEIGPRLFLNARVGHTSVATREAGPGMIDSRTRTVHADLSRQFGAWRLLGRATEIRFEEGNARRRSLRRRVGMCCNFQKAARE